MVIAAMYLLIMVGRIVFGEYREPDDHHAHEKLPTDLNAREIGQLPIDVLHSERTRKTIDPEGGGASDRKRPAVVRLRHGLGW